MSAENPAGAYRYPLPPTDGNPGAVPRPPTSAVLAATEHPVATFATLRERVQRVLPSAWSLAPHPSAFRGAPCLAAGAPHVQCFHARLPAPPRPASASFAFRTPHPLLQALQAHLSPTHGRILMEAYLWYHSPNLDDERSATVYFARWRGHGPSAWPALREQETRFSSLPSDLRRLFLLHVGRSAPLRRRAWFAYDACWKAVDAECRLGRDVEAAYTRDAVLHYCDGRPPVPITGSPDSVEDALAALWEERAKRAQCGEPAALTDFAAWAKEHRGICKALTRALWRRQASVRDASSSTVAWWAQHAVALAASPLGLLASPLAKAVESAVLGHAALPPGCLWLLTAVPKYALVAWNSAHRAAKSRHALRKALLQGHAGDTVLRLGVALALYFSIRATMAWEEDEVRARAGSLIPACPTVLPLAPRLLPPPQGRHGRQSDSTTSAAPRRLEPSLLPLWRYVQAKGAFALLHAYFQDESQDSPWSRVLAELRRYHLRLHHSRRDDWRYGVVVE